MNYEKPEIDWTLMTHEQKNRQLFMNGSLEQPWLAVRCCHISFFQALENAGFFRKERVLESEEQ